MRVDSLVLSEVGVFTSNAGQKPPFTPSSPDAASGCIEGLVRETRRWCLSKGNPGYFVAFGAKLFRRSSVAAGLRSAPAPSASGNRTYVAM